MMPQSSKLQLTLLLLSLACSSGFNSPFTCVNVRELVTSTAIARASNSVAITSRRHFIHTPYSLIFAVQRRSTKLSESNGSNDGNTADPSPSTKLQVRQIANHLSTQNLDTLLSKEDAIAISNELFFTTNTPNNKNDNNPSPLFNENSREQYIKYWNKIIQRLRDETRTPSDLLGKQITNKILKSIRGDNIDGNKSGKGSYDANTVRTFLESEAINSLFAKLLYDAIFEFTTKFDILGNAISNLPLLGPMRAQILKESKRNMDRTLGPLLQGFLSGYTRVAIRQAVDFVVSEENASSFGKANARLVGYLLEKRAVSEWIPEDKTLDKWREDIWEYLVGLEEDGKSDGKVRDDQKKIVQQSLDWTYELVGDKCVQDLGVDVDVILDASPTLERKLGDFWDRVQSASTNPNR